MDTLDDLIADDLDGPIATPPPAGQPYDYRAPRYWQADASKPQRRTPSEGELDRLLVRIRLFHRLALDPAQRRMLRDMRVHARRLAEYVHVGNPFWRSKLARSRAFGRRVDSAVVPASLFTRADIDRVIAIAAGLDPDS